MQTYGAVTTNLDVGDYSVRLPTRSEEASHHPFAAWSRTSRIGYTVWRAS